MSAPAPGPRHPSDADRERAAAPALEAFLAAVAAGDGGGVRAVVAESCVWLTGDGPLEGAERIAAHLARRAAPPAPGAAFGWTRAQPHGAHAALGWEIREGDAVLAQGLMVVEVRRERVVFGAEAVLRT